MLNIEKTTKGQAKPKSGLSWKRFGNVGLKERTEDAGQRYLCAKCGKFFYDDRTLPYWMDICCPYCGVGQYTEA